MWGELGPSSLGVFVFITNWLRDPWFGGSQKFNIAFEFALPPTQDFDKTVTDRLSLRGEQGRISVGMDLRSLVPPLVIVAPQIPWNT